MKKKTSMYQTLKVSVFGKVTAKNGTEIPAVKVIDGHLVVNNDTCDLRTIKERFDPTTKELTVSAVNNILCAESFLTKHYGKRIGDRNILFDFVTADCSGGNDYDPYVKQVKDLICYDGLHLPLDKLEAVGYICHPEIELVELDGVKYVRYRAAMQSASENRQCKLTLTTYRWDGFASTISSDAHYLYEPTQTPQKALSRQGLGKTNGHVLEDFSFSFALVPDLEVGISFPAKCFYDATNEIKTETITTTKVATDGCGFVTSRKAHEIADRLGLGYVPSAIQFRYGQCKGVLLTFDFDQYSNGVITHDVLITESMYKAGFDASKAEFLVCNVSKPPRKYAEMNYQQFCCLNSQLAFDDVRPYVEDIKGYMERALSSPECALQFLGLLSDVTSLDSDESGNDEYACVDKVSAVIKANPSMAMNIKWVKSSIKRKINLVCKKMLSGKIPVPHSSIAILGCDPLSYFNRLRVDESGVYNFDNGELVVPQYKQNKELSAGEFYRGGYEGKLLAARNPLTHTAQVRVLDCVSHKGSAYWYRHLGQVVLFNVFDETAQGMAGCDFDGDMAFLSELFVDRFTQSDFIIYNNNDVSDKSPKSILTEELVQRSIRSNLQQSQLGLICNLNTRCLELMHDEKALRQFVNLVNYKDNVGFGIDSAQQPYLPKFRNIDIARAYLESLNHQLTTLSELTVDAPKTGYRSRFDKNQQEYALPFAPYWFANLKGQLESFTNLPLESFSENHLGESVRTLAKSYNGGRTVKVVRDTLKSNRRTRERWVQRTVELLADSDTIMSNIQRFVQSEILDMEVDATACYSIVESIKGATCLDHSEAERIMSDVRPVYKSYCHSIAANIRAMKDGAISQDEFDDALENIINISDEKLRVISSDRAALAYVSYVLSLENGYGSQSFPFLVTLDGMVALLSDLRNVDYYDIRIKHFIPDSVTHLIVHNRRCRLPESVDPSRTYFGDVPLANGSYELHRSLKKEVSLIMPKTVSKNKLNAIPYNDAAPFSLKVSYKASELATEHQNGEYVTSLMANSPITFKETTMGGGNTQFAMYVDDIWCGSIFDDIGNTWVLKKEVTRTLMGKEYEFVCVPRTGKTVDSNSFVTSKGTARSAQVLTFKGLATA